jgi:hypothetical protein
MDIGRPTNDELHDRGDVIGGQHGQNPERRQLGVDGPEIVNL